MKETNCLAEMENLFLAVSDKTRLRILNLMREDEVCVYYFTEVLGESQPKISRHLAYLRNAGIVSARREGKWIYYKIEPLKNVSAESILQDTLGWLKLDENMREDYKKLAEIKGSDITSEVINQELSPDIFVETYIRTNKREELEIFLL